MCVGVRCDYQRMSAEWITGKIVDMIWDFAVIEVDLQKITNFDGYGGIECCGHFKSERMQKRTGSRAQCVAQLG